MARPKDTAQIDPRLEKVTKLMDESIPLPGTKRKIGLDGIIGLIPVVGDLSTGLLALWSLQEAKRLNLPKRKRFKIGAYYFFDFLVGSIPLVGDIFDLGFKANRKSIEVMQDHVKKQQRK